MKLTKTELKNIIRECLKEELQNASLVESSLTAEEKVDAWHNGTRRENYKAAGEAKLKTYLDIAKSKGYDEIVDIIEAEFTRRGITSTPTANTTEVSTSPEVTSDPETTNAVAVEEPSTDVGKSVTLSDKDLEALLGMAIQKFGTGALSAYSIWKSAGGFLGSYSLTWRNNSGNIVKPDRAVDKIMDLAYDHDKLILLVDYFRGGPQNIDRYYSIDVPSSTNYIVDRGTIYKKAREAYSYYD